MSSTTTPNSHKALTTSTTDNLHGIGVAKVMRSGSCSLTAPLESDLADQRREGFVDHPLFQSLAGAADKERGGLRVGPVSVSQAGVLAQRMGGARVQRHLAPLVVLAVDAQHAIYGASRCARAGSRSLGGISVRGSIVARYRANPRITPSRVAHQIGLASFGSRAHRTASSIVTVSTLLRWSGRGGRAPGRATVRW